ncbi:unnamed protein product [Phytophthora fragariaefolia]|uniref:Unnamed protein product n=1 Tax=Phytophthora fragariaefolia TaxID=1490495 RepID=A0A9W7CTP9_9STRA|nr:unnamed protein product [Phytophthora fragariaefolia]
MGRRSSRRQASFSELTKTFERLNVATDAEIAAEADHRAASARRASASQLIVNPFAVSEAPASASSPVAASDVSVEDVSTTVLNAPALLAAPVYKVSTFQERRVFMRQYERYTTALMAFQTPANRPFAMPVSACIEGDTRRRIAMFECGCMPHEISEDQWVQYFLAANVTTVRNYAVRDKTMKALRMDTTLKEAPSRMSHLQQDLYKILEAHNLTEEMFSEAPRRVVGNLLEALEPQSFRDIVRHQLTLESNKQKKKRVVPFCMWVTIMLEQYMQWNNVARAQKTPTGRISSKPGRPSTARPHIESESVSSAPPPQGTTASYV